MNSQKIDESFQRGIPVFVLKEETTKFINSLRKHLKDYSFQTTTSQEELRNLNESFEETLKVLEEEINDEVQENLWHYIRQI